jgi:hypothetical protein
MARYETTEEEYYCDKCDRYCTEAQMWYPKELWKAGGYCPGCKETHWIQYITLKQIENKDRVTVHFDPESINDFRYFTPR